MSKTNAVRILRRFDPNRVCPEWDADRAADRWATAVEAMGGEL